MAQAAVSLPAPAPACCTVHSAHWHRRPVSETLLTPTARTRILIVILATYSCISIHSSLARIRIGLLFIVPVYVGFLRPYTLIMAWRLSRETHSTKPAPSRRVSTESGSTSLLGAAVSFAHTCIVTQIYDLVACGRLAYRGTGITK